MESSTFWIIQILIAIPMLLMPLITVGIITNWWNFQMRWKDKIFKPINKPQLIIFEEKVEVEAEVEAQAQAMKIETSVEIIKNHQVESMNLKEDINDLKEKKIIKEKEIEEKIFPHKEIGREKENIILREKDMKKIAADRGTEIDNKLREAENLPLIETGIDIMIIRVRKAILSSLQIEHITQSSLMGIRGATTADRIPTTDKARAEITIIGKESMIEYQFYQ